ncbi:MAG TPA: alkaline phosphatase family protein [Gaiellales bacterium]|nr:alkaline phosphatase family protein [Gaiellales bacterium]
MIVIVMENHSFGEVIGHAPYIDALAGRCGLATAYSAVSHPSLPNYLAITSGRTWGVGSDCAPAQCSFPVNSIFAQVGGLHLAWHAFEESMPAPCDLSSSGVYAVKHDPAAYYTAGGVRAACARDVTRLGNWTSGPLHAALAGSLPAYNFVTPNVCNDMHDCPVSTGDLWLHRWIPAIIASPAYQSGTTVVLITWDEGGSAGNTVPLIVVSPATPRGVRSARPLSHYSLLRTSEYLLGAHRFLGGAARAAGLSRTFNIW